MKKYFAIMVAVLFAFGTTGMAFAQQQKQDAPAKPIEGKKTEGAEKRQAVTPDKKKAAEAPAVAEGQAKRCEDDAEERGESHHVPEGLRKVTGHGRRKR